MDRNIENLIHPVQEPMQYQPSEYCNTPKMLARNLPGMVSVNMRELFPSLPEACYEKDGDDLSVIAEKTREALQNVDMSDITPETSVNIVCSEHGFCLCGGKPYLQMVKTLRDVVLERTGCIDLRLRVVMWRTPRECLEAIDYYNLNEEFDNNVGYSWAYDKAVAIETRIGTMYGLEKVYDADKIILAYYDDPREVYCHRMYRKSFKAFTMNMARFETRSMYHQSIGKAHGTTGNLSSIVPTSIYESDFVQSKWTFGCFLTSSPSGIDGVYAGNDLYEIDDHNDARVLKYFSYPLQLYRSLDNVNALVEGGRWHFYIHGGGLISGVMLNCNKDWLDLDDVYPAKGLPVVPGLRSYIVNQAWYGITLPYGSMLPTILVGDELTENITKKDIMSKYFSMMPMSKSVKTLQDAIDYTTEVSHGAGYLIFDGSFGFVNCSRSIAEEMIRKAPAVMEKVDNELYPKYMKQRGLEIPSLN